MHRNLLIVGLLTTSQVATAQQRPDAGKQTPQLHISPVLHPQTPNIHVNELMDAARSEPGGAQIRVDALRVTGQTVFAERELIGATSFASGRSVNLGELRDIAAQITSFYKIRGYFLAQAYLPEQNIQGRTVTIAVVEGHYGSIAINNETGLSSALASGVMSGVAQGDTISTRALERRLLLLSDIPGIDVSSTLSPGSVVGTSDLVVKLSRGRLVSGLVEADNGGNRFTGSYRGGGTLNFNNPTGRGDVLTLRALASSSGLGYGRAAYQSLIGNSTVGLAISHVSYSLGREFSLLDANGTANVASLFGSHPLVRSRNTNLNLLGGADLKFFKDRVGVASTVSHRLAKVLNFGFAGKHIDYLAGGGSTVFSVGATVGDLEIKSEVDRTIDQSTARTRGNYGKLHASIARLQRLTDSVLIYGALRGQIASKNLDTAEKMQLGGAYGVRAYPEGEGYGDEGYVATLEARLELPGLIPVPGDLQLFSFVDAGAVRYANDPWFTGPNTAHRSGIGAGLSWTSPSNYLLKGSYAHKLGSQAVTSERDRDGRFWFQVTKLF